jgi:hypothetical protein
MVADSKCLTEKAGLAVQTTAISLASRAAGPSPTLGELQARSSTWFWRAAKGSGRAANRASTKPRSRSPPFVIRWGPQTSSDVLRQNLRCTACARRGAALQHPGWIERHRGREAVPWPFLTRPRLLPADPFRRETPIHSMAHLTFERSPALSTDPIVYRRSIVRCRERRPEHAVIDP